MIDYADFFLALRGSRLEALGEYLRPQVESVLTPSRWGDLPRWLEALACLPDLKPSQVDLLQGVRIGTGADAEHQALADLTEQLQRLIPWRKGPIDIFGVHIDTEWRSDWKWQRVAPHLQSLQGRTVLDIGCGNGYYALRMHGAGAARVVGIDPSPRFVVQFYMLKKYLGAIPVDVLPLGIEALPAECAAFDTTFSMGVFYHRRSPMDHLRELKETLAPGGELVLETLVIDGGLGEVLVPEGRYAMMNNVWFLPSCPTLISWMKKVGFENVRVVDCCVTTTDEQRSTNWMRFHSLEDFLDPADSRRTLEGHPAPMRAVILANKPNR